MLAVIVAAHNEALHLRDCLASLKEASRHPALADEPVMTVVVCDDCDDDTEAVAREFGALAVSSCVQNTSLARAAGADLAVWAGARWLSFIDARAIVDANWLAAQVTTQADVVTGRTTYHEPVADGTASAIESAATPGPLVSAGNFGLTAAAYCKSPCFTGRADADDHAVSRVLAESGLAIVASPVMVATVARQGVPPLPLTASAANPLDAAAA